MLTEKQYGDHQWVMEALKKCQEAETDMREQAREAHEFVHARQGQWEPRWWEANENKPRYTFDITSPVIDQIAGSVERTDFSCKVSPMGGGADEDKADIFNGMIRAIENISNAEHTYNTASRNSISTGLDGWRVVQEYCDSDSFDQDLKIKRVGGYLDRVWLGPHEEPDGSDAEYAFVLNGMTKDQFEAEYPGENPADVASDRVARAYYHRNDLVLVGEFLYLKPTRTELMMLSDGRVVRKDKVEAVLDELAEQGVMVVQQRPVAVLDVKTRLFGSDRWLTEEQATVFSNWLPVVPLYSNFNYYEDKVTYFGAVERLMDPQRIFNYSKSREVEEGALAPRAKYWMTPEQADGHEDTLATLNVNSDPVQLYNPDEAAPGRPEQSGGAAINPGLKDISDSMNMLVNQSAGMFAANMGETISGNQSGVAIEALQERGDTGSNKFIEARKIAQQHTARILVDAIPKIYTGGRLVRLLSADGTQEFVQLNQAVTDEETGTMVEINDLSVGKYDVICEAGRSFKNRQSETVATLVELGKVDPSVIEMGGDVLAKNVNAPGMDDIAERKRQQLFSAGMIPFDQMTPEEQQQVEAMQNEEPQETPEMVLARAEEGKAQADLQEVQRKAMESQQEFQLKMQDLQLKAAGQEIDRLRLQIDAAKAGVEIQERGASAAKLMSEAEAQDIENAAVESGITKLMEVSNGAQSSGV